MEIKEISERSQELVDQLVVVWEDSVQATHLFLFNTEIAEIKEYVPIALKGIQHLIVAFENNEPIAFMGIENDMLEMLFIVSQKRGKGIGKQLLLKGIQDYGVKQLTVNEQNPDAKSFYEHLGFQVYKRSEYDEQGNHYPILYMSLRKRDE